jgi:predicted benzoate:H+ symporter BenE
MVVDRSSQAGDSPIKSANLALKFLLELCALAALAVGFASIASAPLNVVLAIAAPLVAAIVWGRYAAPKSSRRLATTPRLAVEMAVFAAACAALVAAGAYVWAAALAGLVVVNMSLLLWWKQ